MQIACPSCAAEYEVPAARMRPGRKARCTRCGTEWPLAAEPEPEPAPETEVAAAEPVTQPLPAVTAMDRLAAAAARAPRSIPLAAAWVLTFLILTGGATSAIVWRGAVMRTWAPSGHILLFFGHLPEKPAGNTARNSNDQGQHRE